ncbi:hypothetical protein [Sphingomonas sp. NIBR02145]|uniref:hypothetical protein n=1 Tax=Sphingomonas sp. NIBR02145 TaxID=3014784 RepID=UPI0022B4674B|nr:hypothetical protein [Sphingomonas sp. NIBR02145]WHU03894.1 hypothetical protein O3305_04690 [Sphingomonas sp. NIBR02145]
MNFMQFLKSLDDLLYEIITWLVFYPITLWRTIRHPFVMMAYADSELEDTAEQQYPDVLSPPIFLLLTLLLSHTIELALVGQSSIVADKRGLSGLISDDTSLLLMRLLFFAIFPLIMAVALLRRQKAPLTRDSLKPLFYAQCYPAGVFALVLGIGSLATQMPGGPAFRSAGLAIILAAFLWYGSLQTLWFARTLAVSKLRGFGIATMTMVECVILFVLLAALLA